MKFLPPGEGSGNTRSSFLPRLHISLPPPPNKISSLLHHQQFLLWLSRYRQPRWAAQNNHTETRGVGPFKQPYSLVILSDYTLHGTAATWPRPDHQFFAYSMQSVRGSHCRRIMAGSATMTSSYNASSATLQRRKTSSLELRLLCFHVVRFESSELKVKHPRFLPGIKQLMKDKSSTIFER